MVTILQARPHSGASPAPARPAPLDVAQAVHAVVRCKWSLQILAQVRRGVRRPGAIRRACPRLSTKVLNERLQKMLRFGILERAAFPEIPPRVEYRLTSFGRRFVAILDAIDRLQASVLDAPRERSGDGARQASRAGRHAGQTKEER
ncbi:MAG: winged helix-turn-helix transcriptional regulator [Phycisphaerae bacterium]|jgi:DNA-binding HxlR family transcriptional regulator